MAEIKVTLGPGEVIEAVRTLAQTRYGDCRGIIGDVKILVDAHVPDRPGDPSGPYLRGAEILIKPRSEAG